MKDIILQKRIEQALDKTLSSLNPSAFRQERMIESIVEGKRMKKRLSVGLIAAIVLLMTVSALAAALLTPEQVVERVAVPLSQNNDSDWRVNTDFSPEELAQFIKACAENGIDLDESDRIVQALKNGEGYAEEEAIMAVCRVAFGGLYDEWTIAQRHWFQEIMVQIGFLSEVREEAPGPDDIPEEEAKAIMLSALRDKFGQELPLEDREQYAMSMTYFAPGENNQNDAVWYLDVSPLLKASVVSRFSVTLDKQGNVLEAIKTDLSIDVPYADTQTPAFRLTKEEAAQFAADAIREETGIDVPLMDGEKYRYTAGKSAEDMVWIVNFMSKTMEWGACEAVVNDETGEATVNSADVYGITPDNILSRYRAEYGWYGDWPQDRWVELSENMPAAPAETVEGKALQATKYIPWQEGLITREEAEEIAFRALDIRMGDFNCGVLIDASPNPVWKFRVLPDEKYSGTFVMEIDAVTGDIVDKDLYISDHTELEPAYHMYILHRTWAQIVLHEDGNPLYLAGLAVLHGFADSSYDMPEVNSIPIWNEEYYTPEIDGNTVVFRSLWNDILGYKVVLDENGVPVDVSEQPSGGESPMPEDLDMDGNG